MNVLFACVPSGDEKGWAEEGSGGLEGDGELEGCGGGGRKNMHTDRSSNPSCGENGTDDCTITEHAQENTTAK